MKKRIAALTLAAITAFGLAACGSSDSSNTTTKADSADSTEVATPDKNALKIGIPDDATNGGRGIKLLEAAGLIEVDPDAGWVPEIKDVTKYLYNIEIVPTQANTLPSTLDDFAASTINGTYAIPAGLVPSKDGLQIESQEGAGENGENPFVNVIVARSDDKDNEDYATIVAAYHTDIVGSYIVEKYSEAFVPAFEYETVSDTVALIDDYKSEKGDKKVIKVGVCGSSNDYWNAVQYQLDQNDAGIYLELVQFDAYNLPNDALNSGDIDLNAFQHKAYLANEVSSQGYTIEAIADTLMAPLTIYSNKYDSVDALKEAAGKIN